eukprot:66625-Pyramimonas_sp.AAC.1
MSCLLPSPANGEARLLPSQASGEAHLDIIWECSQVDAVWAGESGKAADAIRREWQHGEEQHGDGGLRIACCRPARAGGAGWRGTSAPTGSSAPTSRIGSSAGEAQPLSRQGGGPLG